MGAFAQGMRNRASASGNETALVALAAFAYLVLVIQDLATTTVLMRGFPDQVGEANAIMAAVIENAGFEGLWVGKLLAAGVVVAVYAAVRARFRSTSARKITDTGLALSCALQGAVVLSNLGAFRALV